VLRDDLVVARGETVAKPVSPRTTIYRCAACDTTIYSGSTRYPATYIVRGGTFDDAEVVRPGAHIWVKRKHPWIVLPDGTPQYDEDYDVDAVWPRESLDRVSAANAALYPDK